VNRSYVKIKVGWNGFVLKVKRPHKVQLMNSL